MTFWRVHLPVLALDLALDHLAQAFQRFEAEALCRLVVDLKRARLRHFLHGDVEGGFLAGQMGGVVVLRESDGDRLLVTGLDAYQLVFEAGDEFLGAQHQRLVAALPAGETAGIERLDVAVDADAAGATSPCRPASSKASRAAACASVRLRIGQPLGITQRPVSRLVMSRMRSPLAERRQQSAATCRCGGWPGLGVAAVLRLLLFMRRGGHLRVEPVS